MTHSNGNVSALWLAMLQRLADRTAHEIRNALNGVAVNLEVVRARSARGTDLGSLTPYAALAAAELERVTAQTDALVSLARAAGSRLDLGVLLGRMNALLRGGANGARLVVELQPGSAETDAGDVARVALAAALLEALEREGEVACRVGTDRGATVYIECEGGGPLALAADVQAALEPAGVTASSTANGIAIFFPSARTG